MSASALINNDVHEIFVQFSKDIAPNLGEYKGGKSEQQIIDLINREVVAERKRLTQQKLDKKLIKSDDLHVEFQFKFTPTPDNWHYGIFSSDNKGKFQIVMDGKNIVKRSAELNQRKSD